MKKMVSIVACLVIALSLTSCLDDGQVQSVAQTSGIFSAVSWIAADNPNEEEVKAMERVLDVAYEKIGSTQLPTNSTYVISIYPFLLEAINTDVEKRYRPLCRAGSITILGGLDLFFTVNIDLKLKDEKARKTAQTFINGAKMGLQLREDDPIMTSARNIAEERENAVNGKGLSSPARKRHFSCSGN